MKKYFTKSNTYLLPEGELWSICSYGTYFLIVANTGIKHGSMRVKPLKKL